MIVRSMALTMWTVGYYKDGNGGEPVRDFMESLPRAEHAATLRAIDLLQRYGTMLKMPYARKVDDLWELRAGANRVFYFAHTGRRFVLLHGFRKKSQKTPAKELRIARRRWIDYLERNK